VDVVAVLDDFQEIAALIRIESLRSPVVENEKIDATFVREPRKIPVVLSLEEVARLLEAAPGPKYKAALSAACGAGLRVSEVVSLKVLDVDSKRMLLRIVQGKGRKDRFAKLSPKLLELLRDWYRIARPAVWLFPGRDPSCR
jgi:integrase/recombinase XerD